MKLWHCNNARSLRALWAREEMGLDYELEVGVAPFKTTVGIFSLLSIVIVSRLVKTLATTRSGS